MPQTPEVTDISILYREYEEFVEYKIQIAHRLFINGDKHILHKIDQVKDSIYQLGQELRVNRNPNDNTNR